MHDMGYWSLRDEGFKPIKFERWEDDQAMLAHVMACRPVPAWGFRGPIADAGVREVLRVSWCLPRAAGSSRRRRVTP